MTILQRNGGRLLLIFGIALAVFGLVEQRDVALLAGAFLAAFGIGLDRVVPAPRAESSADVINAHIRRELEARLAEKLQRTRNDN